MSRTYRFRKESNKLSESRVQYEWVRHAVSYQGYWAPLDKSSAEYRKNLALFHSDRKWRAWLPNGPGWFHNLMAQRPYRRDVKNQIHRCIRDEDFEVQITRKPPRGYWW